MFDVTLIGAFLGGLLIFLSPCILPIVPFYLSYMAGVGMGEINEEGDLAPGVTRRAVISSIFFSLGIITVFVALGAAAFGFSQVFRSAQGEFRLIAAAILVIMGLHFLGVYRIGFLDRQFRVEAGDTKNMTWLSSFLVGLAFAAGWTPCVGGVLTAVVFTASTEETAMRGLVLLLALGVGMTLPFVVAAAFIKPFLRWASRFRRHLGTVEKAMGVFLLLFAYLIVTRKISGIANWMIESLPSGWWG